MKYMIGMVALLLCLSMMVSGALGEHASEEAWFELSGDECVVTLRLPVVDDSGWAFEISDPETIELLTMETIGDEPGEDAEHRQWVASFRATGSQFGRATIECRSASVGTYSIDLFAVENGQIQIVDRRSPADIEKACVLTTGEVNIRREAGLQAETIGTVHADEQLAWLGGTSVDERGMIWFEVAWNGTGSGWVSARYSKLMDYDLIVEFTGDQVNVRNQAGLDGEIVDVFSRGDTALYLNAAALDESGVAWYSIRTSGGPCWVSSQYVKLR